MKFVHVFIILTLFYRGIFAQDMNLSDNKTIHHRIIGGRTAKIENFPFTACLILKDPDGDDFRGGAAIIGDHWVLTASHCMTYISLESINLGLAFVRSNTRTWNANYSDHMILKTHQHEEYDSNLTDYDIAVIKVKEPFTASHEKPAKLPGAFYKYEDNSIATVLGWGTTDPKAVEPFVVTNLRMVNIKLMNFNTCKELYKQANELVTERMMCGSAAGKDACVFDSGGPLYQNGFLIGVVSWGSPKCADLVLPGVYTKVSIFHHWILRKISENNTGCLSYDPVEKKLRIVGGNAINIRQCPYQLSLIIKTSTGLQVTNFKGAAVIVSKHWAFTSGNNIGFMNRNVPAAGLLYLRGNVTEWNSTRYYNDHKIVDIHLHPEYKTYSRDYNIAIVKVENPFNGRYEKPIKIARKHYKYPYDKMVTILGWGKTSIDQKGPSGKLSAANIKLITQESCDKIYSAGFKSPLTPRMVCAFTIGKDACNFDSGGPLVYNNVLIGLISWGRDCADRSFPGIYTRLSAFHDWIKSFEKKDKRHFQIEFV